MPGPSKGAVCFQGTPLKNVFHFAGSCVPVGKKGHQTGYTWHIVNFPQDMNEIARKLPRLPTDFSQQVAVIKRSSVASITELYVNSQAIRAWLVWLKRNNMYYGDIKVSEEALNKSCFAVAHQTNAFRSNSNKVPLQVLHDQPDLTSPFTVEETGAVPEPETAAAVNGFAESGAAFKPHINKLAQAHAVLAEATSDQNINWPTIGMSPNK